MANPLDLQELQPFIRNMQKEMPIHTESTAKIKRSYSQGMPKNLNEYSAFVDNHFLNDNLAIIEEMSHRDAKHPIPRWFREYQIKHFARFGILNKDRFFTSRMRDGYRKHFSADLTEIREIGSLPYSGSILGFGTIVGSKVFGSTLESNAGTTPNGITANFIQAAMMSSLGNIGDYYDQCAFSILSGATGNMRLGCYDDSSNPANLLGSDTGSFAIANDYAFHTVTEFALTTQQMWVAFNTDTSAPNGANTSTPTNGRKYRSLAYGALPSTFGSPTTDSSVWRMKMGHS